MKRRHLLASILFGALRCVPATAQSAEQQQLRDIYKQLIEINTTDSTGSCTDAVSAMAERLRTAGLPGEDVRVLVPAGAPAKGNLVARLRGTGKDRPILLLAHVDVVEARLEDWERDPFKLVEENGYFFARGASDDKAMAAALVSNLIRYKREKYRPRRDLVLALTCDEEIIPSRFNGVEFLLREHRGLIDAAMAINEGGSGDLSPDGKRLALAIQAGEKVFQTYQLEVTGPGGHSSAPVKDSPITHLADGLSRLGRFDFPFALSETTRAYYEKQAAIETGQRSADMKAILVVPPDEAAIARLSSDRYNNATFRTTCVATMLQGGHATNALPQRAQATVNCRVLPGKSVLEVEQTLIQVVADPKIKVTPIGKAVESLPPPLTPGLMKAVKKCAADIWPGVPIVPTMLTGVTDGRFLTPAGIPTYGLDGMFRAPGSGIHGLNERMRVQSLYEGQEFLYRVVKVLAES
ncbi:MAG: M20/M25/M40 family metallo-hydrolase [Acidobacteriota bacterium]